MGLNYNTKLLGTLVSNWGVKLFLFCVFILFCFLKFTSVYYDLGIITANDLLYVIIPGVIHDYMYDVYDPDADHMEVAKDKEPELPKEASKKIATSNIPVTSMPGEYSPPASGPVAPRDERFAASGAEPNECPADDPIYSQAPEWGPAHHTQEFWDRWEAYQRRRQHYNNVVAVVSITSFIMVWYYLNTGDSITTYKIITKEILPKVSEIMAGRAELEITAQSFILSGEVTSSLDSVGNVAAGSPTGSVGNLDISSGILPSDGQ